MTINVMIDLYGSSHDDISWPKARVIANEDILWEGEVKENVILDLDFAGIDNNRLVVEHYGKMFGENRQWHTTAKGDRTLKVSIALDHVDIKDLLPMGEVHSSFNEWQKNDFLSSGREIPYIKKLNKTEVLLMGYNSKFMIDFPKDVYEWIIVNKASLLRPFDPSKQSAVGSVDWRLDWINDSEVRNQMAEIEDLLEQIR